MRKKEESFECYGLKRDILEESEELKMRFLSNSKGFLLEKSLNLENSLWNELGFGISWEKEKELFLGGRDFFFFQL